MLLIRRALSLPARSGSATIAIAQRAAHVQRASSPPTPSPNASSAVPPVTAFPTPSALSPSVLNFNLKMLPPSLQREFDVEANQRALRHLLRCRPLPNRDTCSDTSATTTSSPEIQITPATVHQVMWRCPACNAQWSARPSDRANQQTADAYRCPNCHGAAVRAKSQQHSTHLPSRLHVTEESPVQASHLLCEVHPQLASQWDTARNQQLQNAILHDATEVHTSSFMKVWWRCPLCCTPWLESVSSRVTRYELATQSHRPASVAALVCPACERRGESRGTATSTACGGAAWASPRRFLSDDRLLLSEALLRPLENPNEISLTSEAMLQWRCRNCQFEYAATVANRFLRHERCPQCSGKKKSALNLLVIQRPDVVADVSNRISRTRLRHITVHDDVELPFVCRACFSLYRMTARARCAVPRGVPACSKCFLAGSRVLADAQQEAQRSGARQLSACARRRVKRKALQLCLSGRSADRLSATANELQHRDGALKD